MKSIHLNEHISPEECYKATGYPQVSESVIPPLSWMKDLQKHMYLNSSLMTLPLRGILCIAYSRKRWQWIVPCALTNNCYLNSCFLLQNSLTGTYYQSSEWEKATDLPKVQIGSSGVATESISASKLQLEDTCGDKQLVLRTKCHYIKKTGRAGAGIYFSSCLI